MMGADWTNLAWDRGNLRAVVDAVMNRRIQLNAGIFFLLAAELSASAEDCSRAHCPYQIAAGMKVPQLVAEVLEG